MGSSDLRLTESRISLRFSFFEHFRFLHQEREGYFHLKKREYTVLPEYFLPKAHNMNKTILFILWFSNIRGMYQTSFNMRCCIFHRNKITGLVSCCYQTG